MRYIYLIIFINLQLFSSNLIKSADTVVDKKHNLIWQDHKENSLFRLSQEHAVEYCEKLEQSGFNDWRLPTVAEYKYIIDKTRKDEIMIDKHFKYIIQSGYWTQDRTWRTLGRYGYYIFFKSGTAYYDNRSYAKYVRCVRDMK